MDEHLPALYTELLEISRKTIVLVIFLHWKLQPPLRKLVLFLLQLQFCLPSFPWSLLAICFCVSFLWYCFESKMPDRKGFLLFSRFRKTSFELFFNETDSVKWSLNYFPKQFLRFVCSNSTLLFSMFFLSWGEYTLERISHLPLTK